MTQAKPTDFDQLYPGRFLKAGQLPKDGLVLTIADVILDELESDGGKKVKGCVSFKESEMQLVLNKTNGLCLKAMFGRTLADWVGKRVHLFATKFNGEDCIRIWGSPDLAGNLDVQIQLPKRKAFTMTLRGRKGSAAPARETRSAAPVDEMDPEPV